MEPDPLCSLREQVGIRWEILVSLSFFFFDVDHIVKVFIEFVTILHCFWFMFWFFGPKHLLHARPMIYIVSCILSKVGTLSLML